MNLPHARSVTVYADLDTLSEAVAQRIAAAARAAITARGVFRVALAGGDTPRRCYAYLRQLPVEWDRVHIYFGDERCLPSGDNQRNDSMAQDALLRHVFIPAINVHAMHAERGARLAAEDYTKVLEQPLDMVLLGMGEDGHTASLFPGNPAETSMASVVPVFDAPKPPTERVSLGMNTLNAARETLFLVAGMSKREVLQRIAQGAVLPASRVIGAEWHIDRAACPLESV